MLYNNDSPDGLQIANHYAQTHPGVTLLGLNGVSTDEQITQAHYLDVIRPQVLAGLSYEIDVIVTTKGLPLRIENTSPNPGTYPEWRGDLLGVGLLDDWWEPYSSLESELTRIDLIDSDDMMGDQAEFMSPPNFPFATVHHAANPYYQADASFDRDTVGYEGMRLASRLDGFSVNDVIASIDRAQMAFHLPSNQLVIADDDPSAPANNVDRMPALVSDVLEVSGQSYVFDSSTADILDAPLPVLGYVGHGSHAAGSGYIEHLKFDITNGAVFHTWESFNAYSFEKGQNQFGQGLIAEWLEIGGTAALGHVQEPGASAANVANEDILWDMLLQGHTFAEAAWAATPQLSFVNTVVGDPLMRLMDWVPGDITLDGKIGLQDLNVILQQWNQNVTSGIYQGDVTGNGFVGLDDLDVVLFNWNFAGSSPSSDFSVPEPAGIMLLLLGCTGMLIRPRHSDPPMRLPHQ